MIKSKIFLSVLLFAIYGIAFSQAKSEIDKTTLLNINQTVPVFKFEISKGNIASLNDYKGKIVLINFFATWCAPCRRELPLIQDKIWAKHKDNPKFTMLTFGREHSWDEVLKFGKDQKLTIPLLPDLKRKVFKIFASESIPRSFLIDENGKIIYISTGFDENHFNELADLVDSKLN